MDIFIDFEILNLFIKKMKICSSNWTLTVSRHAETETFLQSAVLAAVAVDPVDGAVPLSRTLVVDDGTLRPAEEALAALTGDHPIVDAGTLVSAHLARDDLDLRCD